MLHTDYQTKLEYVPIPNTDGLIIRSLLDRSQYHDPDGRATKLGISPALWPMFGLLWPAAIQLAGQLALRPVCPKEKILEIGCGLALASLISHRRGARITASDRHPYAERFLRENLRLNNLPASLRYRHGQWGLRAPLTDEQAGRAVLSERYHLIVGSDLLYEPKTAAALVKFIDNHAMPEAEVWILDANRGYRTRLNHHMSEHRFTLFDDIRLNQKHCQSGNRTHKGRLLKYRRNRGRAGIRRDNPNPLDIRVDIEAPTLAQSPCRATKSMIKPAIVSI